MAKKATFSSKIGLIAATVGSAVGLGNIWRFPAEAQANGGAAFIVLYILCVFLLGVPVMIGEFALGRAGRSDAVGAFKNLKAARGWWLVGGMGVLASYLILSFYMVVAGWTIEYLWQSITGALYSPVPGVDSLSGQFSSRMTEYIGGTYRPLIATFVMIALNLAILIGGVRKGIERLSNLLMPLLFIILMVFVIVAATLPDAAAGYRYFLLPDLSAISPSAALNALGQAFFSLSLGMGILITYAAYFPKDTQLGRTAITVSSLDLLVAVMMGLIIFPAITSFGLTSESTRGATLVFVTLPEVFASMPASALWSSLFFLLLSVAALTSTISIAEVSVAFISDRFKTSRLKSCLIVLLPLFVLSSVCSLSQGQWSGYTIFGMTIFDFLDNLATNIMLPLGSLGLCVYLGWFAPKGMLYDQMSNGGTIRTHTVGLLMFLIKYVAPILIVFVFLSNFL